jgi:Rhodopirellula transposase DDE domain
VRYVVIEADEAALAAKYAVMRMILDERQWRVYLGTEALMLGYGGITAVARASGASVPTVTAGAREAADEAALTQVPAGRSRRPGAGRRRAEDAQPGLTDVLDRLLEDGRRGDPMSAVTWNILSLRDISRQLALQGFSCCKDTIARLMHEDGYSLQGMSRVLEGKQQQDRDPQFRRINAKIRQYQGAGDPVISVDGKKKEKLGAYHRDGRSWQPRGEPVQVRSHDFPDPDTVTITPYGIYDIDANRGFVSAGTSCDTGGFAVNAIRLWWQAEGSLRYQDATRLLITCDAGGSNDYRRKLWKDQLAVLAEETGLVIEVMHFPPGTSKWNKIEHRLFCHITRTWSARPLMTIEDAVAGIAATVTSQGLKCTAVTDDAVYLRAVKVTGTRMKYLEDRVLKRDAFHGEWNYAFLPVPRPAPDPEPEPEPGRPGSVPAAVLNHPAFTGMTTADIDSLVTALELPLAASRDQRNRTLRARRQGGGSGARVNASPSGDQPSASTRLTPAGYVLAARLRDHLNLPMTPIGVLLGVDHTTISHAITRTRKLLAEHGIPVPPAAPPPAPPPRTPSELIQHAAAASITLTLPHEGQTMPQRFKTCKSRTTRDTPQANN